MSDKNLGQSADENIHIKHHNDYSVKCEKVLILGDKKRLTRVDVMCEKVLIIYGGKILIINLLYRC